MSNAIEKTKLDERLLAISKKILSIDELPAQSECVMLMKYFELLGRDSWMEFCKYNGVYQVVHDELINGLCTLILKLSSTTPLEICAGNGKLSYWLNKRGVRIKATDDYSWDHISRPAFVEHLSHIKALEKYGPDLVIACFPYEESTVPIDVLKHTSVKYFIHLGNAGRSYDGKWCEEIEKMKNVIESPVFARSNITHPTFDNLHPVGTCDLLYEIR